MRSEKECVEAQLEAEVRGLAAVREKLEQKIRELQAEKESFESLVEHDLDGLLGKLQKGLEKMTTEEPCPKRHEEMQLLQASVSEIRSLRDRVANHETAH